MEFTVHGGGWGVGRSDNNKGNKTNVRIALQVGTLSHYAWMQLVPLFGVRHCLEHTIVFSFNSHSCLIRLLLLISL